MVSEELGRLDPVGGGDAIPLERDVMSIGRRESCDICLRFPSISGIHCQLILKNGYWIVRDMGSTNGIKVNNERVLECALRPGDELNIANRRFKIQYNLTEEAANALEEQLNEDEDLFGRSLMEKAGLGKKGSRGRDD